MLPQNEYKDVNGVVPPDSKDDVFGGSHPVNFRNRSGDPKRCYITLTQPIRHLTPQCTLSIVFADIPYTKQFSKRNFTVQWYSLLESDSLFLDEVPVTPWLKALQETAANRCQWRSCLQFFSRLSD
ncbi:hypothetical protein CRM22_000085 [Opisthorchis felineus]|uniref:Uncharacterized protein n=1 Tax=Opisthorchis felineus TaxID=147828 RepID=A0A4S2MGL9_OPIFE|nr:hypothetical protein CRM22_000085 [Opisthorchis felineus]